MIDKCLQTASQHSNGKASIELDMTHALEEKFDFETRTAPGFVDSVDASDDEFDDFDI
jgi:hypothetical protein